MELQKKSITLKYMHFQGRNWLRWLADVLPRQQTQVWFLWKKLSSMWFSELVIVSVYQPDAKQGGIVIHAQSATLCVGGGR
eukprot:189492-Ditylum_brightwellii.AAC.1